MAPLKARIITAVIEFNGLKIVREGHQHVFSQCLKSWWLVWIQGLSHHRQSTMNDLFLHGNANAAQSSFHLTCPWEGASLCRLFTSSSFTKCTAQTSCAVYNASLAHVPHGKVRYVTLPSRYQYHVTATTSRSRANYSVRQDYIHDVFLFVIN